MQQASPRGSVAADHPLRSINALGAPPKREGGRPMKIKKFVGGSMGECLLKVKRELGEDAVILDSRKIARGGPFSFLLTDMVEVVASTDADQRPAAGLKRWADRPDPKGSGHPSHSKPTLDAVPLMGSGAEGGRGRTGLAAHSLPSAPAKPRQGGAEAGRKSDSKESGQARISGSGRAGVGPAPLQGGHSDAPLAGLGPEFALMSDELQGVKEALAQITDHLKYRQLPSLPRELEILHRDLLENGVEERVAAGLTQEMALRLSGGEFEDRGLLRRALHEGVGRLVKAAPLVGNPPQAPLKGGLGPVGHQRTQGRGARVIALVGPTGVGKTTTLAKMATHAGLLGRQRVGLVSADTYRIAAVEQLKTFAAIAKLGMEAVYRPSDMAHALERMVHQGGCDVVLIDTAGRSPNDGAQLQELSAFLEYAGVDEVHLVLSMGTRLEDQLGIIGKFSLVKPSRLIFTKLDETTSWGSVLNVCAGLGQAGLPVLPVSLLTWGQDVPDDIISPSQGQLARLVCERGYYQELRSKK